MGSLKNENVVEGSNKDAILYVNGVLKMLPDGLAHLTLLEYLRDVGLTGTKLGCGEGGCGACTVMVSYFDQNSKKCLHRAINACLAPLYSVEGMHVITVEGLGDRKFGLHPVQESLASRHGSQCGFCTPGFIMSMYALLRSSKTPPSEEQIEESLAGNLCRCTGYRPILDAFRVFAKSNDLLYTSGSVLSPEPKDGEFICPSTGKPCSCGPNKETTIICHDSIKPVSYNEIDGSSYTNKEHIFPPQLLLRKSTYLSLNGSGGIKWHRPLLLKQILDLKSRYPDAKLVVGNTEVGIETRLKKIYYPVFVSITHVPELNALTANDDGIEIGAGVRLSELQNFLKEMIDERPVYETSACKAITEQIKWFAGTQIRNVASVGGNICTASPISDLNPLWMASRAKFNIVDIKGNVRTVLAENFFLGYRKVDLGNNEILLSVMLPWTRQFEYVKEFKQAHRRDDDIALVNSGMRVYLEKSNNKWTVSDACVVYGGVAPVSLSAVKTKDYIIGKVWNKELLQNSLEILTQDVVITENAPGGMVEFRKSLTLSFFFKFYMWVCHQMDGQDSFDESLPVSHLSAIESFHRPSVMGSQQYEITKQGTSVGSPEVHMSARLQVTGEAEYTDDTPMAPNGLHAAMILSKKPHARLVSIDDSGARSTPGFAGVFFAKDIPGDNIIGPAVEDEEVFASEIVTCVGQVIGVVVADTHENAKLAARKVNIEYEELPAILSIEDAVKSKSFHPNASRILSKGDVELCLQSEQCHKIIEGEVHIGGQEHFYLEPQSTFVWTTDGGNEVHLISSTQAPRTHQKYVAHVLDVGLTGTKLGCGEGGCGACTVMVSYFDQNSKKCLHRAINACLAPLYSVEGMHVITVEGLGDRKFGLHPVQESLASRHGSQCGFCTPGFIMSMYALLRSSKTPPSEEQIEESLAGNLCRCTGYRPILDAFRVFAKSNDLLYTSGSVLSPEPKDGEFICPSTGKPCSCGPNKETTIICHDSIKPVSYNEIDGSSYTNKEHIFPPQLLLRKSTYLSLNGSGGIKWHRPLLLKQILDLKSRYPDAKLVVGNTEVGIETRLKKIYYPVFVSITHVPELNALTANDDGIEIGAGVRLSELQNFLKEMIDERPVYETSACKAITEQIKWFAGTQIRNVASVGGNICTASPISDLNPLWMASRAKFNIVDIKGNVRTVLAENFFLGYRKVDLGNNEILLSVMLPWTRQFEYVKEFKQAHRRDDDIALVNSGMRVYLEKSNNKWTVSDACVVYGGVAPVSLSAVKTKDYIIGKVWNKELLQNSLEILTQDVVITENAPGGMVEFRKSLTLSFFFKFYMWVCHQMDGQDSFDESLPVSHLSAIESFHRPSVMGSQQYEITKQGTSVGSPEVHMSARLQVTGEAEYTDDTPMAPNGLHAAMILSKKPHARLVSIDDSGARSTPGFAGVFFAKDIPGDNIIGPAVEDEEVFASEIVTCVGQVIGVVVADTHENAKLAARKVNIEYEELPAILSIEDAVKSKSFHPNASRILSKGDVELCLQSEQCHKIIEGEVHIGGQEHFYLEPQSTFVWTTDGGNEVHLISSTQAPRTHQKYVAHVLGLPMSKVVCKVKRIGGGFGGKETRSAFIAAVAAVPAYMLNRPVKLILDRDVDMMTTGQRHSFLGKYKVGFTNEGKVLALDLEIYNNAGNSLDLSLTILERAMYHSNNAYEIPHVRINGNVCFTNFPSNTAFRGFGGPQGMLIAENWIQRIATEVKKSPEEIREINFLSEGSILHYGQQIQDCTLNRLWGELKNSCKFSEVRKEVEEFNLRNRWKKRGIAIVPTKFGIGFTIKFMNQAGALVQVYTDGTVLVTHGGVEMGQGLHTKVAQIAASAFDIPLGSVFISETSTDKVPNASPTAASASSDVYGAAVLDACNQLKARMEPIASLKKHSSFKELVLACYLERVDLSAHGFYIVPDVGFDWSTGKGRPFSYFTYGAAFAEVEIDTLTGDFHTRAADVILDLGFSINPAIDVGQIEGAFVQGMGWVALEELKRGDDAHNWIPPGYLFTSGPGNYKIPSVNDVPFKFNVSILKDAPNGKAVHSSKAVGEPPFFLASSVFFAIKDAIIAARAESGSHGWFPLDNPATPERIRMACIDDFTAPFVMSDFRPKLSV